MNEESKRVKYLVIKLKGAVAFDWTQSWSKYKSFREILIGKRFHEKHETDDNTE